MKRRFFYDSERQKNIYMQSI